MLVANNVETETLAHHGIVAAIINKLKLIEKIDETIPKKAHNYKLSHGQAVAAMILNGLGFVERRLYMVSSFFENKPTENLIGNGITPSLINDDVLGRSLDAIFEYGPTKFFAEISFEVGLEFGFLSKSKYSHLDTSTISVTGNYTGQNDDNEVKVTYGHSKDHRPDLKQLTLSLSTTGPCSYPLWMEALSGNSSDKESFHRTIESVSRFQAEIKDSPPFHWVADAAFYSQKKLLKKGNDVLWISRVPENITSAKNLLSKNAENYQWQEIGNGYSMSPHSSYYGGVDQRWILIFSEEAYKREMETFNSNLEREEIVVDKKIKKINNKIFLKKTEAEDEYKTLKEAHKFFTFIKKIVPIYKKIVGKTELGKTKKKISGYQLTITSYKNISEINKKKNTKGRFILATNNTNEKELKNENILKEYKDQSKTERGFRFIKDKSFSVGDMYLKNADRLQALMCIMCLSLLVYNVGEFWIREKLKKEKITVPNQINKQILNPTLKWIFQTMKDIVIVKLKIQDKIQRIITNLTEDHRKILNCLGGEALEIYGLA